MTDQVSMIAENIRAWRARKNMSQDAVAEILLVHRNTIARWERGETEVPMNKAWELADLFGVTLDDLAGRTNERAIA